MSSSTLTSKGQVTIPAPIRRRLGLMPGDPVTFVIDGDEVRLVRELARVEAAFGLCKPNNSLSIEDMERVIADQAGG